MLQWPYCWLKALSQLIFGTIGALRPFLLGRPTVHISQVALLSPVQPLSPMHERASGKAGTPILHRAAAWTLEPAVQPSGTNQSPWLSPDPGPSAVRDSVNFYHPATKTTLLRAVT